MGYCVYRVEYIYVFGQACANHAFAGYYVRLICGVHMDLLDETLLMLMAIAVAVRPDGFVRHVARPAFDAVVNAHLAY